jgi:fructose-1,6-bisphosphatase/inositol monophosphatase family enzyme
MNLDNIMETVAFKAGAYLREHAFDAPQVEWKTYNDPVTNYDKETEKIIYTELMRDAPGDFIGEESSPISTEARIRWIVDPIDGTKDWVTRDFHSGVSIGLQEDGELTGGVVYDFMKDIMYRTYKGNASIRYAGKEYPMREHHGLAKMRVSLYTDSIRNLFPQKEYAIHKRNGSIALCMAELAAGNYDAMVDLKEGMGDIWDIAAGYALLRDTGCTVLDGKGNPYDINNPNRGTIALRPHAVGVLKLLERKIKNLGLNAKVLRPEIRLI